MQVLEQNYSITIANTIQVLSYLVLTYLRTVFPHLLNHSVHYLHEVEWNHVRC
jgi:hypothetical protein